MIAALYVQSGGVYCGLPDIDPWDEARDARTYAGPWPVVAHPPCARWGKYWHGGPDSLRFPRSRKRLGDDGGCFAAALASVRHWGGVLEHPAYSHAWRAFGLLAPPLGGGWVSADFEGGWTCHVEQGHYGHRARKATWLYVCRPRALPSLTWGPSAASGRLDDGFHTAEERLRWTWARRPPAGLTPEERESRRPVLAEIAAATGKEYLCPERISKRECVATPIEFRDLLLSLARECRPRAEGKVA